MGRGKKVKDITGQKFGRLIAIDFIGYSDLKNNRRFTIWKFKCECGNFKEAKANTVIMGGIKSCGCLSKERYENQSDRLIERNKKEYGVAAFNGVYNSYKQRAKRFNYDFELNKEEFKSYIYNNCNYCGSTPKNIFPSQHRMNKRKTNGFITYNGIDRIDSSKGYTKDNIVTCCETCNYAKKDLTLKEFEEWIVNLINFYKVKIK